MSASKNPTTTIGDMIYASATNTGAPGTLGRIAAATGTGKLLQSQNASIPVWLDPGANGSLLMSNGTTSAPSYLAGGAAGTILQGNGVTSQPSYVTTQNNIASYCTGTSSGVLRYTSGAPVFGLIVDADVTQVNANKIAGYGSASPAGYIGEIFSSQTLNGGGVQLTISDGVYTTFRTITSLSIGNWQIVFSGAIVIASAGPTAVSLRIHDGTNTLTAAVGLQYGCSLSVPVFVSTPTSFTIQAAPTTGGDLLARAGHCFYAIRRG